MTNDIISDRLTIISRSGRVFETVNYWQVLLAHGPLQKSRSLDRTWYQSAVWRLGPSIPLITGNRGQLFNLKSQISNLKSIDRSHLRNFHQKCDRSVCCLTIRAPHPFNNREQRSIDLRFAICDFRLKRARTSGLFTKNAIGQSAVWRLGPSIPLIAGNRGQSIFDFRFSIFD